MTKMSESQQINSRSFNSLASIIQEEKKYSVIYADPPWTFASWSKKGEDKSAQNHYDCMTMKDINNLPVNDITEKNAVLFMWMTSPMIKQQMETIEAWGFQYKTMGFVWVKKNKKAWSNFFGLGYYSRANAEFCAICTKGKPGRPADRSISQIVESRIREHSRKPPEVKTAIEKMYGGERLEMFAREKSEGWDVFGNEYSKFNKIE